MLQTLGIYFHEKKKCHFVANHNLTQNSHNSYI
jgi:hypothetical protein